MAARFSTTCKTGALPAASNSTSAAPWIFSTISRTSPAAFSELVVIVPEDLDGDVGTAAGKQLVKTEFDGLGKQIALAWEVVSRSSFDIRLVSSSLVMVVPLIFRQSAGGGHDVAVANIYPMGSVATSEVPMRAKVWVTSEIFPTSVFRGRHFVEQGQADAGSCGPSAPRANLRPVGG